MKVKQMTLLRTFVTAAFCFGAIGINAQSVTKTFRSVPLKKVLKEVERQTKMSVIYRVDEVNANKKINATFNSTPVRQVLNKVLDDGLEYDIDNRMITIHKSNGKSENRDRQPKTGKTKNVKGLVLDENNEPIIGATVRVKGTRLATVTDMDGNFSLNAPEGSVLLVSYLGYKDHELSANSKNTTVNMSQNVAELNEVVVTALGIKKEAKSLSYNVQQLDKESVMKVQDANFVNSLNGKVAGVQFSQGASGIGGSTRVVMRGAKSLNGNNNVLYVIDGIPMNDLQGEQPEGIFDGAGQSGDAVSSINPDDIESLSVLTGPSAAALYGANASNGVILITTKKGKKGKVDVTYTGSFQFSHPFVMHEFQNEYGPSESVSYFSWGEKLATPSNYEP